MNNAEKRMIMTEFISRNCGKEGYEIIIKTDSHEYYKATEDFARRLVSHSKSATNADRIRNMTDEELAMLLYEVGYDKGWDKPEYALNWLQQPEEDIDDGT